MTLNWQTDNKTYRESGSYRFSSVQRGSMVLAFDVEIVSVTKEEYRSKKSNPANGHYGYAVIFYGSSPIKRVDLEFPVTRVFHSVNELATNAVGQYFLAERIATGLQSHYDCLAPPVKLCLGLVIAEGEPVVLPGHPHTVVKVQSPPGTQINLIAYWVDIPNVGLTNVEVEGSDPSDGLDEYPEPKKNDPNDPWAGNPAPSSADPASDPRDFGGSNTGYPGGVNQVVVRVEVTALTGFCGSATTKFVPPDIVLGDLDGPFEGFENGDEYVCSPEAYLGFRLRAAGRVFGPFNLSAGVVSVTLLDVFYN